MEKLNHFYTREERVSLFCVKSIMASYRIICRNDSNIYLRKRILIAFLWNIEQDSLIILISDDRDNYRDCKIYVK